MKRRDFLKTTTGAMSAFIAPIRLPENDTELEGPGFSSVKSMSPQAAAHGETYRASNRVRSGMALGGMGAGTLELRKNGCFYNWNIFNNFPKETGNGFKLPEGEIEDPSEANLFFLVRYQVEGQDPKIKLLQLSDGLFEGGEMGIAFTFPWMQAVDRIEYSARYPISTLVFTADDMPFVVTMRAWTPFIPHDVKNSSLPLAYFDFRVTSESGPPVDVMLIMSAANNAGYDTADRFYITTIEHDDRSKTVTMGVGGMDQRASTWGQIALTSLSPDSSYYAGWAHRHPYLEYVLQHPTLPNLDDTRGVDGIEGPPPDWLPRTHGRNRVDPETGKLRVHDDRLLSSVARSFRLQRGATVEHTFAYTWNFPNLYGERSFRSVSDVIEGHFYSNFFDSAASVARYASSNRDDLYRRTRLFLDSFFDSSADAFVLEQINSQLNTFATNGRLVKSGDFGVLEGLSSTWSWGPIATIDVMLYGSWPVIALFPELQKSTMRAHMRSQTRDGEIAHGLQKGFFAPEDGTAGVSHRIDLPGQYVALVMRDFFWTGDLDYLREMYPSLQRAIEYVIQHRSFPGTSLPLIKGIECSYDNFPMYGYASYILSQWLLAMECASRGADALGDAASQDRYRRIADETRTAMEAKLWNGKYFSLYNDKDKAAGHGDRSEGCLTDQLVGQWCASQVGLESLLPTAQIHSALQAILDQSYRPDFGLRNCSWPGNRFYTEIDRDTWVDQGNTCWSGVELAFASFLLYQDMTPEALAVIRTVDSRYRKNGLYFDHQEFGGHYFRPMSAWSIVNGLLGLAIDRGELFFAPRLREDAYKLFFATPTATAHYLRSTRGVELRCLSGKLSLTALTIAGGFANDILVNGRQVEATRSEALYLGKPATRWVFSKTVQLKEDEKIEIRSHAG